jgi:hypothetical protein
VPVLKGPVCLNASPLLDFSCCGSGDLWQLHQYGGLGNRQMDLRNAQQ